MCHRWLLEERKNAIDPEIDPGIEKAWTFSGCDQALCQRFYF
jgi:hypothetical protein